MPSSLDLVTCNVALESTSLQRSVEMSYEIRRLLGVPTQIDKYVCERS